MEKNIKDYLNLYLGCEVMVIPQLIHQWYLDIQNLRLDDCNEFNIKLILRPLSDMMEEESAEYDKLSMTCFSVNKLWDQIRQEAATTNYLRSNHIDCDGLIEIGLAIDKTI